MPTNQSPSSRVFFRREPIRVAAGRFSLRNSPARRWNNEWIRPRRARDGIAVARKGVDIMLCLSRKKSEELVIGDDIRVMVIEIRSGQVRLGVSAPAEIPVHRAEVYDQIHRHSPEKLDLMVRLVRGEPLHSIEERHDRSEFEQDMIPTPSSLLADAQMELMAAREEIASLRSQLSNREHI